MEHNDVAGHIHKVMAEYQRDFLDAAQCLMEVGFIDNERCSMGSSSMYTDRHNQAEYAQLLYGDAVRTYREACAYFGRTPQCTIEDAVQHFNAGGSVAVRTRGHNVLYAKRWHTEAVLTSAIQESDSFNCVGGILC